MVQQIVSNDNNERFCLYVTIRSKTEKVFRVVAADQGRKNSKYADRIVKILPQDHGVRDIFLSFPVSPKQIVVTVANASNLHDKDFEIDIKKGPMKASTA